MSFAVRNLQLATQSNDTHGSAIVVVIIVVKYFESTTVTEEKTELNDEHTG